MGTISLPPWDIIRPIPRHIGEMRMVRWQDHPEPLRMYYIGGGYIGAGWPERWEISHPTEGLIEAHFVPGMYSSTTGLTRMLYRD